MISSPSSQTSQPRPHAPMAGWSQLSSTKRMSCGADVDAEGLERLEVELLRVARVRLEDDLELGVHLEAVRVLAVAAVIRPHGRLDVRHVPRLGTEHPQKGGRVHRPCADLGVVGLHDHATSVGPELLQREQGVLDGQRGGVRHPPRLPAACGCLSHHRYRMPLSSLPTPAPSRSSRPPLPQHTRSPTAAPICSSEVDPVGWTSRTARPHVWHERMPSWVQRGRATPRSTGGRRRSW